MTSRVLVVGGTGFVGSAVVATALGVGHEVHATAFRGEPGDRRATWCRLDLRDGSTIERTLASARPDVVVNAAYREAGADLWPTTTEGAGALAVAVASTLPSARLVHLSTDVVFDGTKGEPYVEHDRAKPLGEYGMAKLRAEELVAGSGVDAIIVRTSLVYSGDQRGSRHEAAVIDAVRHGSGMRFFVDEIRCPIQVDDLARGLVELALAPCPAGPMHLAGPEAVSRAGFARLVAAHRGDDPARVETIRLADVDAPRPAELVLDSTLATRCLGWTPRAVTPVLA